MRGKIVVMALVAALGVSVTAVGVSPTANAEGKCTVKAVGSKNNMNGKGDKFTVSGGKITGKFKVMGGKNCKQAVSIIAWKLPSGKVQPYSQQKMHSHMSGVYGPGVHAISTSLPNCAYQVDMVKGKKLTGPNGGPRYFERNLGWAIKTGKKCKEPKVVTKTKKVVVEKPVYVEKEVVRKEVVEKEVPAELPKTGVGSVISGLIGLPALAGSATYYIRSRRFNS